MNFLRVAATSPSKRLLSLVVVAFALLGAVQAQAATCFAVGGAFTWDNSTDAAHWSSSSGGAGSTCAATGGVPKNAADTATFDASSGGGTVTVNTNLTIVSISSGAFTGTIDWTVNNNSFTLSGGWNGTGAGVRTIKLGNATYTLTGGGGGCWNFTTTTNLTFLAGSSTIAVSCSGTFTGGGQSYNIVTLATPSAGGATTIASANTFATLNISAPNLVLFPGAATQTVTNAPTWVGSSGSYIQIMSGTTGSSATLSVASGSVSCTWCAVRDITAAGGATFTAPSSFDLRHNSGITITPPSGGGTTFIGIIGGG